MRFSESFLDRAGGENPSASDGERDASPDSGEAPVNGRVVTSLETDVRCTK